MTKTIYIIKETVLRNATREEFSGYKKALLLCSQLENYTLVILSSSDEEENNNILEMKNDFFQKFLNENKDFNCVWDNSLDHYWSMDYPDKHPTAEVIVFVTNPAQCSTSMSNVNYQNIDAFLGSVFRASYKSLRDYLEKILDKDLADTKKTRDLFKKYASIIDEFLKYESHLLNESMQLKDKRSVVDVLFEKKQWSLLVVALSSSQSLSDEQHFKTYSPLLHLVLFPQDVDLSSEASKFLRVLKEMLLSPPDILYPALWDKLFFLSQCRGLMPLLPPNDVEKIDAYMIRLIEEGCKKAAAVKKEGLRAELEFLARVDALPIDTDIRYSVVQPHIEACLDKLVKLYLEKEKLSRKNNVEDTGTLEWAVYHKKWSTVIHYLVNTPADKWKTLGGIIDYDPTIGLEVKAFLLRAVHFSLTDKYDPTVKRLADFLANRVLHFSSDMNVQDRAAYLEEAMEGSILRFVLGGHPVYDSATNYDAQNRFLEFIQAAKPDQLLDIAVHQNNSKDIISLLAKVNSETALPLLCKLSTVNLLSWEYEGEQLTSKILNIFVPEKKGVVASETQDHAAIAETLERFLRSDGYLIDLMGSAVESVRKEYNNQMKLAFLQKMYNADPADSGDAVVNPLYADFFKNQLEDLNTIITNKCVQYEKNSEGSLRIMGGKTGLQMKVELEALYALRTAIIETRIALTPEGVDVNFISTITKNCAAVKEKHHEGFAKHAVSVYASKSAVFYSKLLIAAGDCYDEARKAIITKPFNSFASEDSYSS